MRRRIRRRLWLNVPSPWHPLLLSISDLERLAPKTTVVPSEQESHGNPQTGKMAARCGISRHKSEETPQFMMPSSKKHHGLW
ncbi:uncharacterized protein THITE_2111352 [Thermothielavioides terrestris NRRL 8126]|uniref:Uncharacterized protein n=1 Tax=Thermothielavioides terrestris (strain ATCC 38088 / NRRL 8126) TaxID=578455 RepID=G2R285_THETT|nr:uncharacterized protein THITE_2111352 [Thermothielavioides terrestris NRRL 8126]AEO64953.1 hypothetical protein THITE_2111352 [Thermothielavioides terrestris NRRL 8126]